MGILSQNQKYKNIFQQNMTGGGFSIPIFVADFKTVDFTILTGLVIAYIPISGVFEVGETVTGGTSGSTAVVVEDDGVGTLILSQPSAAFTNAETITGGTSGATATVVASSNPDYDIDCVISNNELTPPDLSLPSSPTNQYSTVSYNDLATGTTYSSSSPFNPGSVQESKTFEANLDGARWFFVRVPMFTSGVLLQSDADIFSNFA